MTNISFFFRIRIREIESKSVAPIALTKLLYQEVFKILHMVLVLFLQSQILDFEILRF